MFAAAGHAGDMRTIGSPDLTLLTTAPPGQLRLVDLSAFTGLEAVVRQALAHPARPTVDVVAMDEYAHDVVIVLRDDLVLVFDTT